MSTQAHTHTYTSLSLGTISLIISLSLSLYPSTLYITLRIDAAHERAPARAGMALAAHKKIVLLRISLSLSRRWKEKVVEDPS